VASIKATAALRITCTAHEQLKCYTARWLQMSTLLSRHKLVGRLLSCCVYAAVLMSMGALWCLHLVTHS
jgi:hypothetical protein